MKKSFEAVLAVACVVPWLASCVPTPMPAVAVQVLRGVPGQTLAISDVKCVALGDIASPEDLGRMTTAIASRLSNASPNVMISANPGAKPVAIKVDVTVYRGHDTWFGEEAEVSGSMVFLDSGGAVIGKYWVRRTNSKDGGNTPEAKTLHDVEVAFDDSVAELVRNRLTEANRGG